MWWEWIPMMLDVASALVKSGLLCSWKTPEEGRILALTSEISRARELASTERTLPGFIDAEYAEAEAYSSKALKSFQRGDVRKTKVLFYAANTYWEKAQRDEKQAKAFNEKMAEMIAR